MGKIEKETFKRLYTLYFISKFKDGVYGSTRLQKSMYEALKNSDIKPFKFQYYNHGQFSFDLFFILEQLLSMGYLKAVPLDCGTGNHYEISQFIKIDDFQNIIDNVQFASLIANTEKAIDEIGYLGLDEIIKIAYKEIEELGAIKGETVFFDENVPEMLEIPDLDDNECENLDLILNPNFMSAMGLICNIIHKTKFDVSKVKRTYKIG